MTGERRRCRIVLTGAWGGGKTTLIQELRNDPDFCQSLLFPAESAPLARQSGISPDSRRFQYYVVTLQKAQEESLDKPDDPSDNRTILTHRGTLDALAFHEYRGGRRSTFFRLIDSTLLRELERYDAVILLRTTAGYEPESYERYRQNAGRPPDGESVERAVLLERYLYNAWKDHPGFFAIGEAGMSWEKKSALARGIIGDRLFKPRRLSRRQVNAGLRRIVYPGSHRFSIDNRDGLHIHRRGAARIRELESVLPRRSWHSLIDIGCAKGMFLLWAWQRFGLKRMVGVESAADMVNACRLAVRYLDAPATILNGSPADYYQALRPADLVLVLHCYHYLYFGSLPGRPGISSHDFWFDMLARLTADTLVFANPVELSAEKISLYRQQGVPEAAIKRYNEREILESAGRHFYIEKSCLGGGRPYRLMRKRGEPSDHEDIH